jgi:PAS domain S-box-containing protein
MPPNRPTVPAARAAEPARDLESLREAARRLLDADLVEVVGVGESEGDPRDGSGLPTPVQAALNQAQATGNVVASTSPADSSHRWQTVVCVPLRAATREVEAVLCLGSAEPREWSTVQLEVLQHLGEALLAAAFRQRQAADAELARREAEALLNDVDAILWEADPATFRFTFISQQAERLLGYPLARWLEPGFWMRILHPDDRERMVAFCQRATAEGRDHAFDYRAVAADGRTVWLRDQVRVISSPSGVLQALRGVMTDITAEKEATADLQQISDRARCILWTAEVRETERDFDWSSLRVSNAEAAQRLLPLSLAPGETYADAWYESKPLPDREQMASLSAAALRAGRGSYSQEYRCLDRDGELRWFLEEALIEPTSPGVWQLTGVSTDITARKIADHALVASERRYRALTERSTDLLFILDGGGRFVYESPSTERLLGYTPRELDGQLALDLVHPEDRTEIAQLLRRRIAEPERAIEITPPYRFQARDGSWRYLESTGANLLDDPAIQGIVVNSREVTERVRIEADLRYATAHARCILWHAQIEDLHEHGLDWRITLADPAAAIRFFPLTVPPGISYYQVWFDSRLDGDRQRSEAYGAAQVRAGRGFRQEFRCRDATGAVRWLREDVQVEALGPDRWKAVGVCTDVTEQREAEAALREREELLRLVSEAANDVLWTWDLDTDEFRHFGALQAVLGCDFNSEQPDHDWWKARLHPDDREHVITSFFAALESTETKWSREYRFLKPDGSYAVLLDRAYCVRDEAGRPRRVVGAMMDVSGHRHAEARLHEAQKMEAVGRLAGGVAHDFNNMLAVINGYSELLLGDPMLPEEARRSLGEISKAGDRAANLTRQLLAFGRKQLVVPEAVDLAEVVGSLQRMLSVLIGEHIRFQVQVQGKPGRVFADRGQLEQALVNLVVNACDAMPRGGLLTLDLREVELSGPTPERRRELSSGAYVLITLTDTGTGIPAEVLAHIFEPFFTTKAVGQGTGLGLATAYAIVQQHHGLVEVESQPGAGTTFRIYLPRMPAQAPHSGTEIRKAEPSRGSETVLLAEDEPMLRQLVADVLQSAGYQVLVAAHGPEALQRAGEHVGPIHLLLTDVVMPGGSGRELAQALTAQRPETAVLYTSGHTDDALLQHGISSAEVDFLQKPFTPTELTAKVRTILDHSRIS